MQGDTDQKKYEEELEKYDPKKIAQLMLENQERKIPASVSKPHNPYTTLI